MSIRINLLGAVEVFDNGRDVTPSAPKIRRVLAMLTLRCKKIVPAELIVEELWGENPPKSAMTTLQTYIYQLRRSVFVPNPVDHPPLLLTKSPGYQLNLPPEDIDVWRFRRQLETARELMTAGQNTAALVLLKDTLSLWRGKALADVQCGPLLEGQAAAMNDAWLSATELRFEAELALGAHANIVGELRELITGHPLNENLHAQLILALSKSNRRAEALTVYQEIRVRLREELGSEPSDVLRQAQAVVLGGKPDGDCTRFACQSTAKAAELIPAQLPPDVCGFIGRAKEIAEISAFLAVGKPADTYHVLSVTGSIGVGKSCLAVHVAHQVKNHFPDGQLFAEMQTPNGDRVSGYEILGSFLRAIHNHPADIPDSLTERSGMFRSALATRSMLIVLDQVDDVDQIRPLIPAGRGNAVVVTNRKPLHGLPGIREVLVEPMVAEDALALFSTIAWNHPVSDDPESATKVIELCGRLPLAIRAAAERLHIWNHLPLNEFAIRLEKRRNRFAELRTSDFDLFARIDVAYRAMDNNARHILQLLGLTEKGIFTECDIQRVMRTDRDVESILVELLEARLVEHKPVPTQDGQPSYQLSELIQLFALERLSELI